MPVGSSTSRSSIRTSWAFAGQLVARITGAVKDDHTLGADVTGLKPKVTDPPNPALAGLMWNRQDGSSSVQSGIGGSLASTMTLKQVGPLRTGSRFLRPCPDLPIDAGGLADARQLVRPIPWRLSPVLELERLMSSRSRRVPEYVAGTIISGDDKTGDTTNEMFVSVLGPLYTILGIPTWPGYITPTFNCFRASIQHGPHPGEWASAPGRATTPTRFSPASS